jgi:hypothetical protein
LHNLSTLHRTQVSQYYTLYFTLFLDMKIGTKRSYEYALWGPSIQSYSFYFQFPWRNHKYFLS